MAACVLGSAFFSGLTLGLMSIDCLQLEIIMRTGTELERKYASAIYPVRKKGNLLLCTLLIGNMFVNNSLAILMADVTSGIAGALITTAITVVFGEVVPQAFCTRYGLAVGGRLIFLIKASIMLFFPASYPVAWVLDKMLGAELIQAYSRQELSALVEIQAEKGEHDEEKFLHREATLLKGAINFSSKIVEKVMTPISEVFMLEIDTKLDWQTCAEIFRAGHSRIPVYEKERNSRANTVLHPPPPPPPPPPPSPRAPPPPAPPTATGPAPPSDPTRRQVVGLLIVKDLILLDPDDEVPVRMVLAVYGRPLHRVFPDTRLDMVLNEFKTGKAHVALVHRVNDADTEKDPFYEIIGLVTLEDVMEELIGEEIVDETDVYLDMQTKRKVSTRPGVDMGRIGIFQHKRRRDALVLSVPECKAIYAYLSEQVPEFGTGSMAEAFALRMLYEATLVVVCAHAGDTVHPPTDSSSASRRHGREVVIYERHFTKGRPSTANLAGAGTGAPLHPPEDTANLVMGPMGPGHLGQAPLAIYRSGEPNQHFMAVVIQGELDVVAGKDGFRSRAGPWSLLGPRALKDENFAPDFSAFVPGTETVRILKIHRDEVRAAMHATKIFAADAVSNVRPRPCPPAPPPPLLSPRFFLPAALFIVASLAPPPPPPPPASRPAHRRRNSTRSPSPPFRAFPLLGSPAPPLAPLIAVCAAQVSASDAISDAGEVAGALSAAIATAAQQMPGVSVSSVASPAALQQARPVVPRIPLPAPASPRGGSRSPRGAPSFPPPAAPGSGPPPAAPAAAAATGLASNPFGQPPAPSSPPQGQQPPPPPPRRASLGNDS
eukprot:tig00020943_g16285.t1